MGWMTWMGQALLVPWLFLGILVTCHMGLFYHFIGIQCQYPSMGNNEGETQEDPRLRVAIISDIHLLGKRRRSWIERWWVDQQIALSFHFINRIHHPDVYLVLGDQFDEGSPPTSLKSIREYNERFARVFGQVDDQQTIIYNIGNHDGQFGSQMTEQSIQRYERFFGSVNKATIVKNRYKFVQVNSMILDERSDPILRNRTIDFVEHVAPKPGDRRLPTFLLIHMPLYRPNDLNCGRERDKEGGHITYEHPGFEYEPFNHVMNPKSSNYLLEKIQPNFVFSGHTHAVCRYHHSLLDIKEFTVPAFTWGMRPDPSFALATIRGENVAVELCALPYEPVIFAMFGGLGVCILLYGFLIAWQRRKKSILPSKIE